MVTILMSLKMATLRLLKIKVFSNKGYDVMISAYDVINKSLEMVTLGLLKMKVFSNKGYGVMISVYDIINKSWSSNSNYIIDVVKWPKFGNSNASLREVMIISIL